MEGYSCVNEIHDAQLQDFDSFEPDLQSLESIVLLVHQPLFSRSGIQFAYTMSPTVSICIPSRNTRPFLEERKASIIHQTFQDFEVIVVDDASIDGSWEFFEDWAGSDSRVQLHHGPGKGLYPGWNDCLRRASGEFVHVATSDDTMSLNFLEETVKALKQHPECSIAHGMLRQIDQDGNEIPGWWESSSVFSRAPKNSLHQSHIRTAPVDGLLHVLGRSVYVSVHQLVIRRTLFDEIGYFEDKWGSVGDFHWNMRAGLTSNVIHVPHVWAGWRQHPNQATSVVRQKSSADKHRVIDEMVDDAYSSVMGTSLPSSILPWRKVRSKRAGFTIEMRQRRNRLTKAALLIRGIILSPGAAFYFLSTRVFNTQIVLDRDIKLIWRIFKHQTPSPHFIPVCSAVVEKASDQ